MLGACTPYSIKCTSQVENKDIVGAVPVGTAPTISLFSTWLQCIGQRLQDETRNIKVFGLGVTYIRDLTVHLSI